uniref:PHD-type domain-containing protein n=1 Tax=Oryzias latipes TaxID=8090 RepID=A0A3P9JFU0_ORYLA
MNKVSCILCQRSEETEVTGALSTKQLKISTKHQDTVMIDTTAHQNCLLYSSGIFCKNSPEFDDLFGFAVHDVLEEVQRGQRLKCPHCRKRGATAGCEIKKCKKSFHYPCAVEHGAKVVEDQVDGKYGIYCPSHSELVNGESIKGVERPHSSKSPRVSRTSKKSTANGAPSSPGRRSWSGSSSSSKKRRLTSSDEEEEEVNLSQVKRNRSRIMTDESSESGDGLIAPVGSDESLNSSPEQQSLVPQPSSSEPQKSTSFETEDRVDKEGCDEDDDKTMSDAESESLLNHARPSCSRQSSSETNEAAENARFSVAVQTIKKECEGGFKTLEIRL